jgi:hypothetical protein
LTDTPNGDVGDPNAPVTPLHRKSRLTGARFVAGFIALGLVAGMTACGSSSTSTSSSSTTAKASADGAAETATTVAAQAALCKDTADDKSFDSKKQGLYAARVGVTKDDHEAALADCVRVAGESGYVNTVTVINPSYGSDQGILANVTVRNRDKKQNDYNMFDWKIQTPAGTIESATIFMGDTKPDLGSGQLVTGGEVTGNVVFDYAGPGTYYVIWKPDAFNSGSGVWGVVLP